MRYALLALVFVVGCAEATDGSVDAPDLGTAPHDGAPDMGGDARVCDAAVETLSGTATYVAGSAVSGDPDTLTPGGRCGDLVAGTSWDPVFSPVTVTGGTIGARACALVAGTAGAAGCAYTLRLTTPMPPSNCLVTRDYLLVVP